MKRIALSGIKPTGIPHLGNYLGMIRPALELAKEYRAFYFIADAHALNQTRDAEELARRTYETAAALLAAGLNPEQVTFFRQSDIPEVFELAVILAASTAKGLLNRAHAYKAAVDANRAAGRDEDAGINMGLFTYPILMAADILLYGSHAVPVGGDQRQHIEMTQDIAEAFNRTYGEVLTIPEAVIGEAVADIPGTDGRKMSKGSDNVIPIFAPPEELRRRIAGIVTDSRPPHQPKDPGQDTLFRLYAFFATPEETDSLRARYLRGGIGYGEVKQALFAVLQRTFGEARGRYEEYARNHPYLNSILRYGAVKARAAATPMLKRVRQAVGIGD
ncbi:MAG: tryptophan--tRNA ligase [Anaerolineales bacterium]|nr:tryptophan--tRNA ligase [Anaerolineales bacterium]